jgi:hypothetical protein
MLIDWLHVAPTILAAFLASLVEFVEALTVVRKRCSVALRLQFAAAGFQHQGMSSSICAWGQPLTRWTCFGKVESSLL